MPMNRFKSVEDREPRSEAWAGRRRNNKKKGRK